MKTEAPPSQAGQKIQAVVPYLAEAKKAAQHHVSYAQLTSIDQLVPAMMVATVICSSGLAVLLWESNPGLLTSWAIIVDAMCLWRLWLATSSRAKQSRKRNPAAATVRAIIESAIMAVVICSVPAWLLPLTSGVKFTIVICLMTGYMWAGGLILASLPQAAVAYLLIVVGSTTMGVLASGIDALNLFIVFLFMVGGYTAGRSSFRQNDLIIRTQLQRQELEHQGDVIRLLLNDFEEQSSDWLWETDEEGRLKNISHGFAAAAGRELEELEGKTFSSLASDKQAQGDASSLHHLMSHEESFRDVALAIVTAGKLHWWAVSGRPSYDAQGVFIGYRGVGSDVTAVKEAEGRIAHLALHDSLTNLPNRVQFSQVLEQALSSSNDARVSLLSLDLDGFKDINDTLGHSAGDHVLQVVSERLLDQLQDGQFAARISGDEFLVLCRSDSDPLRATALGERLIKAVEAPVEVNHDTVHISASIGIVTAAGADLNADRLLLDADLALYKAKAEGRRKTRLFTNDLRQSSIAKSSLKFELREAWENQNFELYYQPQVNLADGSLAGAEALIRWNAPYQGVVAPGAFLHVLENDSIAPAVGDWIIRDACRQAAAWRREGSPNFRIGVNLFAVQLKTGTLLSVVQQALADFQLPPSALEIEVTENIILRGDDGIVRQLEELKLLGVGIAFDDFGTGFASLSMLRDFPITRVKIDRSFVSGEQHSLKNQAITAAIVQMAAAMGLEVIAEGIETVAQSDLIRGQGCLEGQGYLYGRPVTASALFQGSLQSSTRSIGGSGQ